MHDLLSPSERADLGDLWHRRQQLSPDEMGRMYGVVTRALQPCTPSELRSLGECKQELIAQFIYAKVLRLKGGDDAEVAEVVPEASRSHSAPSNAIALCAYFRRYLIDCTRSSRVRTSVPVGEDGVDEAQLEAVLGRDDEEELALRDHGLDDEKVRQAARRLIDDLPEPERLLLCEGFGQEQAGGLSGVASRHRIASYHYRAGKLGLVHGRTGLPKDYGRTTLGGWIHQTLGIAIERENMSAILRVFKILALEASSS